MRGLLFRGGSVRQYAAFVDVGFLKASGSALLGRKPRDLRPNAEGVVEWCRALGSRLPGTMEYLRTYWYDGAFDPKHREYTGQRAFLDAISFTPGLSLRLGHIQERHPSWQRALRQAFREVCGELDLDHDEFMERLRARFQFLPERQQKGVDARIVLDLVRLGQDGVYDAAVLMTGDRDIAEAIKVVQDQGRRVILASPKDAGTASEIRQLVDMHIELSSSDVARMLSLRPEVG